MLQQLLLVRKGGVQNGGDEDLDGTLEGRETFTTHIRTMNDKSNRVVITTVDGGGRRMV